MNRIARRFVLLALGLTIGLTGGMSLLNLVVDPFNRYGLNHLGVYISAERECKSTYVTRFPHDALLVGNSRETRIPPAQLEGFRFFNGAFSGATPEEVYFFLQHFAWHQRLVVLAVDVGEQDPAECHGDIFAPKGLTSALDNLLNLQTTEYSIRTISESLSKHPQPIGRDGLVPVGSSMLDADRDDPAREAYRIKSMEEMWDGYRLPVHAADVILRQDQRMPAAAWHSLRGGDSADPGSRGAISTERVRGRGSGGVETATEHDFSPCDRPFLQLLRCRHATFIGPIRCTSNPTSASVL